MAGDVGEEIKAKIRNAIRRSEAEGGMISAEDEAWKLLREHPDCGWTFQELQDAIARSAAEQGLVVAFGSLTTDRNSN